MDRLELLVVLLFCIFASSVVYAFCPNGCSGHGVCTPENSCTCDSNYRSDIASPHRYLAADCSALRCPYDKAWVDKAWGNVTTNMAHSSKGAECSNAGYCNRGTGICECLAGYEGQACQRQKSACNGNGIVMTMSGLYTVYSTEMYYNTLQIVNADNVNDTFSSWEADRLTSCVCDRGFTGPHCEMRMCPKGDDPLTHMSDFYTINIHVAATHGTLGGYVHLIFNGETLIFPADHGDWSLTQCKESFEKTFSAIGEVRCTRGSQIDARGSIIHTVSIRKWNMYPYENNIYTNDGAKSGPMLGKWLCKTKYITGDENLTPDDDTASCVITEPVVASLPEYDYCSNRGICNFNTGQCNCYADFTNPNCDTYSYGIRAIDALLQKDIMVLQNTRNSFTGNVLKLSSNYPGSKAYNMLKISDSAKDITTIDGEGNMNMHYGGLNIRGVDGKGGMTIHAGGLEVTGGLTVYTKGLTITGGLTVHSDGLFVTEDLVVANGMTVSSEGIVVTGGITLKDSGLTIERGGLIVASQGMTIAAGGLNVGGSGVSIATGGLAITAGVTIWSGGLDVNYAPVNINSGGLVVSGGVSVNGGGLTITGGLTVTDVGIVVTAGGMTIDSEGLDVSQGLTVTSGGMNVVQGGIHVLAGGLYSTGGLSIGNTGLFVRAGGMQVTGGLTVQSGGIEVTGGLSVSAGGASVAGGLTLVDTGLTITAGGITVAADGMTLNGGISIVTGGITSTGGITIDTEGMVITAGGATVTDGGMSVAGGVTVTAGGLTSAGGLTISNTGLVINAGKSKSKS